MPANAGLPVETEHHSVHAAADTQQPDTVAGAERVIREIAESGYAGTELGDWGFMPTDPSALSETLARWDLTLVGAFVPVALADPAAHGPGVTEALRFARLAGAVNPAAFIVLSDANATVAERTTNAGRITPAFGLDDDGWDTFARGAEQVARAVRDEAGLRTVFHHHCAGYVETPAEVDALLDTKTSL